jgi:hypothetical protein
MASKFWFFFHLFITIGAWFAPFILPWPWLIVIYGAVMLQFIILKTCIVNIKHGLDDSENHTFYAELLEMMGFRFDRVKVKKVVRGWLYMAFLAFGLFWQLVLDKKPWISYILH